MSAAGRRKPQSAQAGNRLAATLLAVAAILFAGGAPTAYTLLVATMSTHALVPLVSAYVPHDPVGDFVPVSNLLRTLERDRVRWGDLVRRMRIQPN